MITVVIHLVSTYCAGSAICVCKPLVQIKPDGLQGEAQQQQQRQRVNEQEQRQQLLQPQLEAHISHSQGEVLVDMLGSQK